MSTLKPRIVGNMAVQYIILLTTPCAICQLIFGATEESPSAFVSMELDTRTLTTWPLSSEPVALTRQGQNLYMDAMDAALVRIHGEGLSMRAELGFDPSYPG